MPIIISKEIKEGERMYINQSKIGQIMKTYQKNTKVSQNKKTEKKSGLLGKKDQLNLSTEGQEIQRAIKKAKEHPDIRQDKVDEIKQKIDTGTYKVDSKKVAEKMIAQKVFRR